MIVMGKIRSGSQYLTTLGILQHSCSSTTTSKHASYRYIEHYCKLSCHESAPDHL